MAHLKNEIVAGQFGFTINAFSRTTNVMSPPFKLAGHSFRLHVFPVYDEFVGFSLIHLSPTAVDVSYSISLKCQNLSISKNMKKTGVEGDCVDGPVVEDAGYELWTEEGDYRWVDPDGRITFAEKDHEDSKWGNEEFISMDILFDPSNGLITDGAAAIGCKVAFLIDLTIHGSDSLLSYKADNNSNYDTKLIELITDEDCNPYDLMSYVDNDIEGIMKNSATSNVRNELVKKKQNRLVSTALYNSQYK